MTTNIERIVVALDAASENRAAIGAAARLAARWKTHLHGVFVEDDDLLRLAHMPFARQVTLGLGVETLSLDQAERQMRAYAEQARRELAAAAKRHGVESSFEIVRGAASNSIGMRSERDFLVCGTSTRPIGGHFRVECRWWSAVGPSTASLLLAHRDWAEGTVAALLQDRGPAAERLLETAARLADAHGERLAVICSPELAKTPGFKTWLDGCLAGQAVNVELDLTPAEPGAFTRRIVELGCRVVALTSGAAEATPERLREMLAKIASDVLVVR
jgi:nucleotide-binding universal stress UspA family protein